MELVVAFGNCVSMCRINLFKGTKHFKAPNCSVTVGGEFQRLQNPWIALSFFSVIGHVPQ